jgi:hypothetical protein
VAVSGRGDVGVVRGSAEVAIERVPEHNDGTTPRWDVIRTVAVAMVGSMAHGSGAGYG